MPSPVAMDGDAGGSDSGSGEEPPSPEKDQEYAAILGNVFPQNHVVGTLPPLIPVPDPDDLQWDHSMSVLFHDANLGINGKLERRHGGWEAVEKQRARDEVAREDASSQQSKKKRLKTHGELSDRAREALSRFPHPYLSIPMPRLESDFRVKVTLSAQTAAVAGSGGGGGSGSGAGRFKQWTTFTGGTWSGHFGYGTVVSGGQETQDSIHGKTAGMLVEATMRLRTEDKPPAHIECKARGSTTGTAEIVEALRDRDAAPRVDPRQYSCRMAVTMKTTDERYAEKLNFGLWVGSCYWRGEEIICDAYRVT